VIIIIIRVGTGANVLILPLQRCYASLHHLSFVDPKLFLTVNMVDLHGVHGVATIEIVYLLFLQLLILDFFDDYRYICSIRHLLLGEKVGL